MGETSTDLVLHENRKRDEFSFDDLKKLLWEHIPYSFKIIGNIMTYEKFPTIFPCKLHIIKPNSKDICIIINEAVNGFVTLFTTNDDSLVDALKCFTEATVGFQQLCATELPSIRWKSSFLLSEVPNSYISSLKHVAATFGGYIETRGKVQLYYLCSGDETNRLITLETWKLELEKKGKEVPYITVKKLKGETESELVAKHWKFTNCCCCGDNLHLKHMIKMIIQHSNTVGIYLHGDGKLVCWILETPSISQGMLNTLEEYRGLGFARLAVSEMSRIQLQEYGFAYAAVECDNYISQHLYESLGFRKSCHAYEWLQQKV